MRADAGLLAGLRTDVRDAGGTWVDEEVRIRDRDPLVRAFGDALLDVSAAA